MELNKKGVFFTITATLIIGLLFFALALNQEISQKKEVPLIDHRITKMNNFVNDLENSYLNKLVSNIAYNKAYLLKSDIENEINTELDDKLIELKDIINQKLKINIEFGSHTITLFQNTETGPWNVGARLNIQYNVTSELANWTRDAEINSSFSIIGLRYPETPNPTIDKTNFQKSNEESFLERLDPSFNDNGCCGINETSP